MKMPNAQERGRFVHTLDVVKDAVGEAGLVLILGADDGDKRLPSSWQEEVPIRLRAC